MSGEAARRPDDDDIDAEFAAIIARWDEPPVSSRSVRRVMDRTADPSPEGSDPGGNGSDQELSGPDAPTDADPGSARRDARDTPGAPHPPGTPGAGGGAAATGTSGTTEGAEDPAGATAAGPVGGDTADLSSATDPADLNVADRSAASDKDAPDDDTHDDARGAMAEAPGPRTPGDGENALTDPHPPHDRDDEGDLPPELGDAGSRETAAGVTREESEGPRDPFLETSGWRAHTPPEEPEEDFVPGPAAPLPRGDLTFWGALVCLVTGPLWLIYLVITQPDGARLPVVLAITLTIAGFALVVSRSPARRNEDDDDDDGAVV